MSETPATNTPPVGRRTRRYDPHRRNRLIDTALDMIARSGMAGTSHRSIARAADVPLGSMTYHFADLDEVITEAFARHADSVVATFDRSLASVNHGAVLKALVQVVLELTNCSGTAVTMELYAAAARRPDVLAIKSELLQRRIGMLEQHLELDVAIGVNALIDGLILHSTHSGTQMTGDYIRQALERHTGMPDGI